MKIVIDIPEWKYKSICEGVEASKRCGVVGIDPDIHESIYNGIPLPKGHGDLIDRDKLRNVCANNQVDITNDGDKNTLIIVDTEDKAWHDLLSEKYAPTVISADK